MKINGVHDEGFDCDFNTEGCCFNHQNDSYVPFCLQSALQVMTGRRTVPNVFIKGTSIGGGSETAELYQSGKLKELLQEQGIVK